MSTTESRRAELDALVTEAERLWRIDYPNRSASTITAINQIARYLGRARKNLVAQR